MQKVAEYWEREFRKARSLAGRIVIYDPRGKATGEEPFPDTPLVGEVLEVEPKFSSKYGPLITIGYGPRQRQKNGPYFFYSHIVQVPVAACREVTLLH